MDYDLIVVGAGVAGCEAALEASRLGLRVLLVDASGTPGGRGLRRGTIPASTFRETVSQLSMARAMAGAGSAPDPRQLPLEVLERAALQVGEGCLAGLREQIASSSVELALGTAATVHSPTSVVLGDRGIVRAGYLILATGSRPRRPPRFPFDDRLVFDSDGILAARGRPRKLVVVGGEVVGCEFASLFGSLGWDVTLVERRRKLIRGADRDVLDVLHDSFRQLGITVAVEEHIEALDVEGGQREAHLRLRLGSGRLEIADRVLVLAGRVPELEGLALDRLDIDVDAQGFIVADEHGRTSEPTVYAVGDVVGHPMRAGTGMFQGRVAARHLAGQSTPAHSQLCVPIYTVPEIALIGMGEDGCRHLGTDVAVGTARIGESLRGLIRGSRRGFVKLIFERASRGLLGAQIVGDSATELVHLAAAWMQGDLTADVLANGLFDYPSLADLFRIAAQRGLAELGPAEVASPVAPAPPAVGASDERWR